MRSAGLNANQLMHFAKHLLTFVRILGLVLVCLIVFAILTGRAHAQTNPPITFGATVTNANGTLNTTLNWSAAGATSCTASSVPTSASWSGTKATSGTQTLPAISLSGTYQLTLACSFPGVTTATISWTAPTTNSDGTPLAKCPDQNPGNPCLLQFKVYRTTTPPINLAQADFRLVDDRNATQLVWTGLSPAGTHTFGVTAINGLFAESLLSNTATKVITTTSSSNASVTLTVNPIPGSPTNVTVQ